MSDGFGEKASMWKIKILNKYRNDKGLQSMKWRPLLVHCLAATAALAGTPVAGRLVVPTPAAGALDAWNPVRNNTSASGARSGPPHPAESQQHHSPQFAIDALMHKYGLGMSERRAEALGLD